MEGHASTKKHLVFLLYVCNIYDIKLRKSECGVNFWLDFSGRIKEILSRLSPTADIDLDP